MRIDVGFVMKNNLLILLLSLLFLVSCAHNPRPESPEQRAERQAQSLQAQQDAQSEPRSMEFRDQQDARTDSEEPQSERAQSSENAPVTEEVASQQADAANVREQAKALRATVRSTTSSVVPVRSVTGSLLR